MRSQGGPARFLPALVRLAKWSARRRRTSRRFRWMVAALRTRPGSQERWTDLEPVLIGMSMWSIAFLSCIFWGLWNAAKQVKLYLFSAETPSCSVHPGPCKDKGTRRLHAGFLLGNFKHPKYVFSSCAVFSYHPMPPKWQIINWVHEVHGGSSWLVYSWIYHSSLLLLPSANLT